MKKITEEELKKIIENHSHWLKEDCEGWVDMKANLSGTDLSGTDLSGTDLRGADLSGTDLSGAKLRGAKSVPFIPMTCPDTGSFTAYKTAGGKIVKLLIPEDARRSSATGRKCRCEKALVVEIQNIDGSKADVDSVSSDYDEDFVYAVGKMVSVKDFCEERFRECAEGIHFFINRQEAVEYGE